MKGSAFLVVIELVTRYLLPSLLHLLSRSQELLVLVPFADAAREAADRLVGQVSLAIP